MTRESSGAVCCRVSEYQRREYEHEEESLWWSHTRRTTPHSSSFLSFPCKCLFTGSSKVWKWILIWLPLNMNLIPTTLNCIHLGAAIKGVQMMDCEPFAILSHIWLLLSQPQLSPFQRAHENWSHVRVEPNKDFSHLSAIATTATNLSMSPWTRTFWIYKHTQSLVDHRWDDNTILQTFLQ